MMQTFLTMLCCLCIAISFIQSPQFTFSTHPLPLLSVLQLIWEVPASCSPKVSPAKTLKRRGEELLRINCPLIYIFIWSERSATYCSVCRSSEPASSLKPLLSAVIRHQCNQIAIGNLATWCDAALSWAEQGEGAIGLTQPRNFSLCVHSHGLLDAHLAAVFGDQNGELVPEVT